MTPRNVTDRRPAPGPGRALRRYTAEKSRLIALHAAGLATWQIADRMPGVFPPGRRGRGMLSCVMTKLKLAANRDAPRSPEKVAHWRRLQAEILTRRRAAAERYGLPGDLPPRAVAVAVGLASGPVAGQPALRAAAGVSLTHTIEGFNELRRRGLAGRSRLGKWQKNLFYLTAAGMAALAGEGGAS